jgi:hypothetical protein
MSTIIGCEDNLKCEFIPLCHSCHSTTNSNREYWEEICMNKLKNITSMNISDSGVVIS